MSSHRIFARATKSILARKPVNSINKLELLSSTRRQAPTSPLTPTLPHKDHFGDELME